MVSLVTFNVHQHNNKNMKNERQQSPKLPKLVHIENPKMFHFPHFEIDKVKHDVFPINEQTLKL